MLTFWGVSLWALFYVCNNVEIIVTEMESHFIPLPPQEKGAFCPDYEILWTHFQKIHNMEKSEGWGSSCSAGVRAVAGGFEALVTRPACALCTLIYSVHNTGIKPYKLF